jgi:hypothetical protein
MKRFLYYLIIGIIITTIATFPLMGCKTTAVEEAIEEEVEEVEEAIEEEVEESVEEEAITDVAETEISSTETEKEDSSKIELKSNWEEVLTNENIKFNGLTWDGSNFWVITYQSSPLIWEIAKLDDVGKIISAFEVDVKSLDDVHNSGYTNLTFDGEVIWANNWNEGIIYSYSTDGELLKRISVPSINQLIPVGITWDGQNLWVLHWVNKTIYGIDREGNETGDLINLQGIKPPLDMGLVWDGSDFWVGCKGSNLAMRVSVNGEPSGYIMGPKKSGAVRDLAWDGESLYWVYQQDRTIYRTKIEE